MEELFGGAVAAVILTPRFWFHLRQRPVVLVLPQLAVASTAWMSLAMAVSWVTRASSSFTTRANVAERPVLESLSVAWKWRGLTAADLSQDKVLTVPVMSRNKKATRHDLNACPLVLEVLKAAPLPSVGPLIVSEKTGLPYRENYYAQDWREIAEAAEVPSEVWSMDARAGAISEAEEATGSLDAARKMASHSTSKTTLVYVRYDDLANNRRVAGHARN